jgi:hypothetical protein
VSARIPVNIRRDSGVLATFWAGIFSPMSDAKFCDSILDALEKQRF